MNQYESMAMLRHRIRSTPDERWSGVPAGLLRQMIDVVERFAASEPVLDIEVGCVCCDGHYNDGPDGVGLLFDGHLPDCPWLVARRLCGMEDADAS